MHASLLGIYVEQASEDRPLGLFQRCNGALALNARKLFEEIVERFPAFQLIKQRLEGNASAAENWLSTEDFRVLDNNAVRSRSHRDPPALL